MAPSVQDIARLKNNGITSFNKFVTKNVNAAVGRLNKDIKTKGLTSHNLTFVFLFIIRIFNNVVMDTQIPIETINAFIPINCGKNHNPKNKKTEPIK